MKTSHLAAATLLFALVTPHLGRAQGPDMVRIEVRVQTDSDREKKDSGKGGSNAATVNQGKTLEINVSGKPKNPETRKGTWTIYGRPAGKGNDLSVIDSGDFDLALPVTGAQKVETKKVTSTYTTASAAKGSKSKPGKRIDATGTKYSGYGVVVKDGDKVVGETYDPVGMKLELEKK